MTLYSLVPGPLQKLISPTFFRYGVMAISVVSIEILSFWIFNAPLGINYLVATVASQIIGIVLNWVGSRYYVFGASKHSMKKEFTLVFITSIFGVLLQTLVVFIAVDKAGQAPLLGKMIAIVATFIWNYIIRKRYIYNHIVVTG